MKFYSQRRREQVLRALDQGERPTDIAKRLKVSRAWVYKVCRRWRDYGDCGSGKIGGHRRSTLSNVEEERLRKWLDAEPNMTLVRMQQRLKAVGCEIKIGALWHQLNKWRLTLQKNAKRRRAVAKNKLRNTTA